jgi:predicted transcriptional regulator
MSNRINNLNKMTRITKTNFKKAMDGSGGILAHIAKKLGVGRSAVTQYVQRHKDVQELLKEEEESINDLAESKLIQKINEGNTKMIKFRLVTKARNRGYIEKQEVEYTGEIRPTTIKIIKDEKRDNFETDTEAV